MAVISGVGAGVEGVHASVAALDALDAMSVLEREDSYLASGVGVGSGVDVLRRRYEIRLERLELAARLEAQLAAMKARDAAEAVGFQQAMTPPDASVRDRTYAEMSVVEEIAGVLTISSAAAGALVEQSRKICSLPPVFQALATGAMSWQHARVIADETEGLDPAGAAALVAHFFDPDAPHPARGAAPGELVPSRFRAKVRAWRERHHPETLQKRHAKGVADRRMEYTPDRDGMAWVSLYLPGDTACAIWNRTTATARGLQGPNEPRTITQLRPDIAASLLLGSASEPGKVPTPRADVLVTVPVFSLLGLTDEPATLDGLGPIPASMARKLVADGADSFYRVLVDPRDGAPLEIGRKNYRLTETIKRWIRMRDGKCTFPGCTNGTPDNDTDHLQAWEHGGTTGASNLAQLCPKHHRLKHHTQWTPEPATEDRSPGWTSPTGRHYKPEHPHPEPTHWPPGILPAEAIVAAMSVDAPQWQQLLAGMPDWADPPPEDPPGQNLLEPGELCPTDPLWEDFYAQPFILPPDPLQELGMGSAGITNVLPAPDRLAARPVSNDQY
ncbi:MULTISPECIES: HNH endonuclease signature motif containing protein [unclassified Arthrobacter]|uniref:HNH endonuclease signature motif containing protein n=1 Tax=unclassified Arthrobacter TaxID=235627 RepID=UPI001F490581|nr:HNH endonuclease signature motif containing protein [Arthrobacter sp. FW306-06-A]UKA72633.1 HNH endonuclease [Arthrobacter sp. FW306-06-A]